MTYIDEKVFIPVTFVFAHNHFFFRINDYFTNDDLCTSKESPSSPLFLLKDINNGMNPIELGIIERFFFYSLKEYKYQNYDVICDSSPSILASLGKINDNHLILDDNISFIGLLGFLSYINITKNPPLKFCRNQNLVVNFKNKQDAMIFKLKSGGL